VEGRGLTWPSKPVSEGTGGNSKIAGTRLQYSATPHLAVPQLFRSEQLRGGSSYVTPVNTEELLRLSTSKPLGLQGQITSRGSSPYLKYRNLLAIIHSGISLTFLLTADNALSSRSAVCPGQQLHLKSTCGRSRSSSFALVVPVPRLARPTRFLIPPLWKVRLVPPLLPRRNLSP